MASLIEDYALIGDTETVALVGRDGSIDWLCMPRFDGGACFAGLLGGRQHGRWRIRPVDEPVSVERTYLGDSLILETVFHTRTGVVAVIDFMPIRDGHHPTIVRIVEGRAGTVAVESEMLIRFDYGAIVPWVRQIDGGLSAIGGADGLMLRTPAELEGRDLATFARPEVKVGDRIPFVLSWFPSSAEPPPARNAEVELAQAQAWWADWSGKCTYDGQYRDEVMRSLITLRALAYAPTGGIVAAATTSLPESLGGVRNWDYRYCWLRDATFTLDALIVGGYTEGAVAWSSWLRRAVAGSPNKMQIMYGVGGERRLEETELDWLPGYEHSAPVRIGNAASGQFQLDVYGEVMDMLLQSAHRLGHALSDDMWDLARMLVDHVAKVWTEPDDGIWEVRGPRRHFVHSKVMAWVAVDRFIQLCESGRQEVDLAPWRTLRDDMHREICEKGYNGAVGAFTQYYGATELDASVLMLPLVGFLPPTDPRVVNTVEAVERELLVDGFVLRYRTDAVHEGGGPDDGSDDGAGGSVDGLPPGEGAFLLTTFWLADNLILLGRVEEARAIFERLIGLANDVGLLAEEYDVPTSRLVGNFPQAFSHVGLILTAASLSDGDEAPVHRRRKRVERPASDGSSPPAP